MKREGSPEKGALSVATVGYPPLPVGSVYVSV